MRSWWRRSGCVLFTLRWLLAGVAALPHPQPAAAAESLFVARADGRVWNGWRGQVPAATPGRELLRDPHFQRGFWLLAPEPGRRVSLGRLPGPDTTEPVVWDLAQWSSRHPLSPDPPQRSAAGQWGFANRAKSVTLAPPGHEAADLILAVNAGAEYGAQPRAAGDPWVHLLVQQDLAEPPALAELASARFQVEARLRKAVKLPMTSYAPDLHAAQFQVFLSVQNLNRASAGYGQYLWFGIPLYDDRHRVAPAHKAQDMGGTQMFIFTPSGDTYTRESAHDYGWVRIDHDLLPLMRKGLAAAWQAGFLQDSRALTDYRIAALNLGWELPGAFDVEMQVRHLSLRVIPR
jgi:hypothetical protein